MVTVCRLIGYRTELVVTSKESSILLTKTTQRGVHIYRHNHKLLIEENENEHKRLSQYTIKYTIIKVN